MEGLESLDCGQCAPVHGINMPDGNRAHDSANTISKQCHGDDSQNHRHTAQGHVVEEVLGSEDLDDDGGLGSSRGGDGGNRMFLETPSPRVDEFRDLDAQWEASYAALLPPASLQVVTSGYELGPGVTRKVSNEYNKGA